jgi:excisionase family DNA binding protein
MSDPGAKPNSPQFLTTEEAAAMLRWTPDTVRRKAAGGLLPALSLGRHWRFEREQLLVFLRGEWKSPESAKPSDLVYSGESGAEIFRRVRERKAAEGLEGEPKDRS